VPTISGESLCNFTRDVFAAAGVPRADAERVASSLIDANLRGHDSHGVIRIPQYVGFLREGMLHVGVELTILNETPAILAVDANWGIGQVQAHRLLEMLLPKAKAVGIASGTLRRCGHIGRLGEYAEWAAEHGLAFFGTVNSHGCGRRVVPPGGNVGRISTNPICFGAPTASDPLVLDFSTSACAEGKVRVAFQKGEAIPEGWILNAAGKPTTNPADLYADPPGSLLPFGGVQAYKGFGLGFMMDLLAGALSGGECSRPDRPMPGVGNAVAFVMWNIDAFGGREHFLDAATGLAEFVRATPRAAESKEIVLPGDPERRIRAHRLRDGIPIPDGTWAQLANIARELGVQTPTNG
jgi:hydroxycarboxylate dehydrogenase B